MPANANARHSFAADQVLDAIEAAADYAIFCNRLDGQVTSWNDAAAAIFGYTAEEMLGTPATRLLAPDHPNLESTFRLPLLRGERIQGLEVVGLTKAGQRLDLSLTLAPIRDASGRVVGVVNVGRDITAYKAATRARLLLASIIDSSDDAIISKTLDGVVTSWNDAAERIFGYRADEMIGRPITALFPPDRLDEEPQIIDRISHGERVEHFETVRRTKDGRLIDVSLTISPVIDADGVIIGASKIARDISAQKRARDEIQQMNEQLTEADRLRMEFIATLSHEFRTPLNSIMGFTSLLLHEMSGPVSEEQKKQLGIVHRAAAHLLGLINDLLDLSRIEAGKMQVLAEDFDPALVVDEVVRILQPAISDRGLKLITDLQLPVQMHSDRKKFFQVLLNLANNAVKFTPKGEVRIVARCDAEHVAISVEDTGVGIKPEQLAILFQAFGRNENGHLRRYEGTGLGLYLCKQLVALLGGEISARSELGKGACFNVVLPQRLQM